MKRADFKALIELIKKEGLTFNQKMTLFFLSQTAPKPKKEDKNATINTRDPEGNPATVFNRGDP
jgi:hypothetical protein